MTITDGDLIIARLKVQVDKLVERLALAEQERDLLRNVVTRLESEIAGRVTVHEEIQRRHDAVASLANNLTECRQKLALAEQALVDAEHHEYHLLAVVKAARRITALQPCLLWVNGRCETHGEMKPCTVERLQKALARLDVTEQY